MKLSTKTTHSLCLVLLLGYLTVLLPAAAGEVLCINYCGTVSIAPTEHACHNSQRCHDDHDNDRAPGDPPLPILIPAPSLGLHHSHNCCTDIPLEREHVQFVVKTQNALSFTPVGWVANILNDCYCSPNRSTVIPFYTPADTAGLATIVLLI